MEQTVKQPTKFKQMKRPKSVNVGGRISNIYHLKAKQATLLLSHYEKYIEDGCLMIENIEKINPDLKKSTKIHDDQPQVPSKFKAKCQIRHRSATIQKYMEIPETKKYYNHNKRKTCDLDQKENRIKQIIKFPSQKILQRQSKCYPIPDLRNQQENIKICRFIKQTKTINELKRYQKMANVQSQRTKHIFKFIEEVKGLPPQLTFNYDGSLLKVKQCPKNDDQNFIIPQIIQNQQQIVQYVDFISDEQKDIQKQKNKKITNFISNIHSDSIQRIFEYKSPYLNNFQKINWNKKIINLDKQPPKKVQNFKNQDKSKQNQLVGPQKKSQQRKRQKGLKFRSLSQALKSSINKKEQRIQQNKQNNNILISNQKAYRQALLTIPNINKVLPQKIENDEAKNIELRFSYQKANKLRKKTNKVAFNI